MITVILLAVPAAVGLWWLNRPGPDVSGRWGGNDWGLVELSQSADGSFEGTYSSTYGTDVGRIKVFWSPRLGLYVGTWGEGRYRFGRVSFSVLRDGATVGGEYSADPDCELQPGVPGYKAFVWEKYYTVQSSR